MRWFLTRALPILAIILTVVWAVNTSLWIAPSTGAPKLISHRGVAQVYAGETIDGNTCTADPILPPTHEFIGNTLPAMEAAFAAGADVVELDVQLTTQGIFAVFQDWTLDCRTEGRGVARMLDWSILSGLDVGYGYTPDGKTYPLRGKGAGMMPRLEQVLDELPKGRFLINFKGNDPREGEALVRLLAGRPGWQDQIWAVHGGELSVEAAKAGLPGLDGYHPHGMNDCLTNYAIVGWSGQMPEDCRDTILPVPINLAPWLWGWPRLFQQRMREAGTEIILIGPWSGESHATAIDDAEMLARVPPGFEGYIWTDRILEIAPALEETR